MSIDRKILENLIDSQMGLDTIENPPIALRTAKTLLAKVISSVKRAMPFGDPVKEEGKAPKSKLLKNLPKKDVDPLDEDIDFEEVK